MAKYSRTFSTDDLIDWLKTNGVDDEDCSKIKAAKFRGATFIKMEKEEHFKEMGIPLGTRLFFEALVEQAKADVANPAQPPSSPTNTPYAPQKLAKFTAGLTVNILSKELESVVDWKKLAVGLDIPFNEMDKWTRNNPRDVDGQKLSLFQYIEKNYRQRGITWVSICDALESFEGNLAFHLRDKYCNEQREVEQELATPTEDPNRLGQRHLKPLMTAVYDVRSKWRAFGLELDLLAPDLEAIDSQGRGVPEECLRMVLEQWLLREKPRPPAFRDVLDALRSRQVNYGAIAASIERYSDNDKSKIGFYL